MKDENRVYIHIYVNSSGNTVVETNGEEDEVSKLICYAMIGDKSTAVKILAAIPSFLDETGFTREGFCQTIMNAAGSKNQQS